MILATVEPLKLEHQQHLVNEGFTPEQIAEWQHQGLRSLTQQEAWDMGFQVKTKEGYQSGSGLYIPFTEDFGQLRLDIPLERHKGQSAKYLTLIGAKSKARLPDNCKVITEGGKDAHAGTVHGGIPTGALAGVSHYRKALPQGAGYTVLFDNDGWTNPAVFSNLFHAGKWLNGKVQLLPQMEGEPKAGLCEYFKAGHTPADYKQLIDSALKPEVLLLEWASHFKDIPALHLDRAIHVAFRLATEYLCPVQQDQVFYAVKAATKSCVSPKVLAQQFEKERAKVLNKQRKKLETNLRQTPVEKPKLQSKRDAALDRRAQALLDSGALLDLMDALLNKINAVGIEDHVKLAVASTLGTLRKDRKRNTPTLFTGSSGIGKSMVLDILGDLLPQGTSDRVSGVSDAVLKRAGDKWYGKTLLIDEFSTWANSETVLSVLKELITRGETSFEILEPGQKGQWDIKRFDVAGPIGIAACATDATISTVFGSSEEEIRSRFNELPLPEDADYITRISRAAFIGLEPESLAKKFPYIVSLIHRAIELTVNRRIPTIDPLLEEALLKHIKPDRPLFPRLLKRLKILLENTAALLGKSVIDLETYSIVFPLVSKVFRRNLTNTNDVTLDNFVRFARNLKDMSGGYLPFKVAKIQELLSASKATAHRWREKWESLGWITEGEGRGLWNVTGKGANQIEAVTEGKDLGLPDILPPITKVKATITHLLQSNSDYAAKVSLQSHQSLMTLDVRQRPIYKGLHDFLTNSKSHESLMGIELVSSPETTLEQGIEVDGDTIKSHQSHPCGENGYEKNSSSSHFCFNETDLSREMVNEPLSRDENIFSDTPPENGETNETLSRQNCQNEEFTSDTGTCEGETLVRPTETPVRLDETQVRLDETQVRPTEAEVRQTETGVKVDETQTNNPLYGWAEYNHLKPYPNPKSDDLRSSQKRALKIREAYRAANCKENLSALNKSEGGEFSKSELQWVWNWLKNFLPNEYAAVKQKSQISQPRLID